jgi:hypothetical protein
VLAWCTCRMGVYRQSRLADKPATPVIGPHTSCLPIPVHPSKSMWRGSSINVEGERYCIRYSLHTVTCTTVRYKNITTTDRFLTQTAYLTLSCSSSLFPSLYSVHVYNFSARNLRVSLLLTKYPCCLQDHTLSATLSASPLHVHLRTYRTYNLPAGGVPV